MDDPKFVSDEEAKIIMEALLELEKMPSLVPEMFITPHAIKVWDQLTEEQRIKAVWFSERDMPPAKDKFHCFNALGFWFHATLLVIL